MNKAPLDKKTNLHLICNAYDKSKLIALKYNFTNLALHSFRNGITIDEFPECQQGTVLTMGCCFTYLWKDETHSGKGGFKNRSMSWDNLTIILSTIQTWTVDLHCIFCLNMLDNPLLFFHFWVVLLKWMSGLCFCL